MDIFKIKRGQYQATAATVVNIANKWSPLPLNGWNLDHLCFVLFLRLCVEAKTQKVCVPEVYKDMLIQGRVERE